MPLQDVWLLIGIAFLALLAAGALAPFETLGWWAGWFGRPAAGPALETPVENITPEPHDADHYVVFLSGIHSVSGRTFAGRERNFLEGLHRRLPRAAIVEVFPYSVTNRPLTGQRLFAWFWRWALSMKLSRRALAGVAGMVINLRNAWQVAVSADRRYGPIYNQGSADLIALELCRAGYQPGSGVPVTLVGYSGGGQIALGAAPHLQDTIGGPIRVVSLGGVMSSDPDLTELERVYHLYGRRDRIQRIGNVFFPGRWPLLPHSAWNQAKQRGIVRLVDMGPPDHTGPHGYLDSKQRLPDGRSYLEQTVDAVAAIVEGRDPRTVVVAASE